MSTPQSGFPYQTVYNISSVTNGYPGVVTVTEVSRQYALSLAEGQTVTIHYVNGMTEINNHRFIVTNFDSDAKTFELFDLFGNKVDTTSYIAYSSGGEVSIISTSGYPPGLFYNQ